MHADEGAAIDYLMLGTVTRDVTEQGAYVAGGTAAFSAATAAALGLRVGLCARFAPDVDLGAIAGVEVLRLPSQVTTTFENRYDAAGRVQHLHARAEGPAIDALPHAWRNAEIVHLGPLAQDLDPALAAQFPNALLGVTPQGWLRAWDRDGRVHACDWAQPDAVLARADAVVLSIEDVAGDWAKIERWAGAARLLVVTVAEHGAVVYHRGERRQLPAPQVRVIEPTGAGDMFAAILLHELAKHGGDVWTAASRAVWLTSMLLEKRSGRFPDAALLRSLYPRAPRP